MNSDFRFSFIFGIFCLFLILVIIVGIESETYREKQIVENTDACFVINEDNEKEFKWSCDDG